MNRKQYRAEFIAKQAKRQLIEEQVSFCLIAMAFGLMIIFIFI